MKEIGWVKMADEPDKELRSLVAGITVAWDRSQTGKTIDEGAAAIQRYALKQRIEELNLFDDVIQSKKVSAEDWYFRRLKELQTTSEELKDV